MPACPASQRTQPGCERSKSINATRRLTPSRLLIMSSKSSHSGSKKSGPPLIDCCTINCRATDNCHEFQAKFHWHVEDKGIRHACIKPSSPQLNGKVERSHRSAGQEFYQLLSYKGDVDLQAKLATWENFYNFARPHGAHKGQTPYEVLRKRLST